MMDAPEIEIEKFFRTRAGSVSSHRYLSFGDGSQFKYIFSITPVGFELVADRLDGPTFKQRLGATIFRLAGAVPSCSPFVPGITSTSVSVPDPTAFDCAIVSGNNITLISPQQGTVSKLKTNNKEYFLNEFETQRSLPSYINNPGVIAIDSSYPYFIQEYVSGKKVTDLRKEWSYVLDALGQLGYWANQQDIDWIPIGEARESIYKELKTELEIDVVSLTFKMLDKYSLPQRIALGPTHGDFTFDNLRLNNDEVYIIDWENKKRAYLIRDFIFALFHWHCYGRNDEALFSNLLSLPNGGTIGKEYAEKVGPFVWDSSKWYPGLVLFGLLYELTQRPREHERSKEVRRLLRMLLD